MSENTSTWKEARRFVDELELELHLARMDARDRWQAIRSRLDALQRSLSTAGRRAGAAFDRRMASIAAALERMQADVPTGE